MQVITAILYSNSSLLSKLNMYNFSSVHVGARV